MEEKEKKKKKRKCIQWTKSTSAREKKGQEAGGIGIGR